MQMLIMLCYMQMVEGILGAYGRSTSKLCFQKKGAASDYKKLLSASKCGSRKYSALVL